MSVVVVMAVVGIGGGLLGIAHFYHQGELSERRLWAFELAFRRMTYEIELACNQSRLLTEALEAGIIAMKNLNEEFLRVAPGSVEVN